MKAAVLHRVRLLLRLLLEIAMLLDYAANVALGVVLLLWAIISGQDGEGAFSSETLSARAGRALMNGKVVGRVMVPVIDWLWSWESHDLVFPDGSKSSHPSHCRRAFLKKYFKLDMPREYRLPIPF